MFKFKQTYPVRSESAAEIDLAVLRLLRRERLPRPESRVLDISCHSSRWQKRLEQVCRYALVESLDLRIGDWVGQEFGSPFEFPADSFQLILWRNAEKETKRIPALLRHCARSLEENGRMVIVIGNQNTARGRLACFADDSFESFNEAKDEFKNARIGWPPLAETIELVHGAGFRITQLEYVPALFSELTMLPWAIAIWIGQLYYFLKMKPGYTRKHLSVMFPFQSLLSKHYVLVCEPDGLG